MRVGSASARLHTIQWYDSTPLLLYVKEGSTLLPYYLRVLPFIEKRKGAQAAFVLWFAHGPTTTLPTLSWSLLCVLFAASGSRFGCPSPRVARVHTVCSHLGPLVWGCWVRVD